MFNSLSVLAILEERGMFRQREARWQGGGGTRREACAREKLAACGRLSEAGAMIAALVGKVAL